jgi:hypothetical protein
MTGPGSEFGILLSRRDLRDTLAAYRSDSTANRRQGYRNPGQRRLASVLSQCLRWIVVSGHRSLRSNHV